MHGSCITPEESNYIWLDKNLLGDVGNVPSHCLLPKICTPLSVSPISRLLSAMKVVLKHNYLAGLLMVSGSIMAMHYSKIVEVLSGCPIVVAVGPSETGKSTSIKAALAFSGDFPFLTNYKLTKRTYMYLYRFDTVIHVR